MFTEKQIEDKTVELLAVVYNSINWSKMRTSKNPHDIFNHRVRAASRRATLFEAISKLANYFGLQSLPAEAINITQELRPYERIVLNKMYMEHIPISMLAIMRAKERKKNKGQVMIFENLSEEALKDE